MAEASRAGDVAALERLLAAHGDLATARFVDPRCGDERTALHVATDWPGHFANGRAVVATLVAAGADIEAPGSVIDGGTPLADAVAFGQWRAARRLVELGARVNLWQAAALGLADRLERLLEADPPPGREEITNAFCARAMAGTGRRPSACSSAAPRSTGPATTHSPRSTLPCATTRGSSPTDCARKAHTTRGRPEPSASQGSQGRGRNRCHRAGTYQRTA